MRATARTLAIAVLALALAGCGANRRVLAQGDAGPAKLVPDADERDVRAAWGEPDRVIEAEDPKTGRSHTYWLYDRYVDTNGSRLSRVVTFDSGRVTKVEDMPVARTGQNEAILPRTEVPDSKQHLEMGP
jgi:hypothetical protein